MKRNILILTAVVAVVLFSCKENPYMPSPGDNSNQVSDTLEILKADTNGILVSVDSAYAIAMSLVQNRTPTAETYKITATITSIDDTYFASDHNVHIYVTDGGKQSLQLRSTNYINNYPYRSKEQVPAVGSKITVVGPLMKYDGKPQMNKGYVLRVDSAAVAE